jgi:hypothetical protein
VTVVRSAWWYVDLRRFPHRYPGPAPRGSGVLSGRDYRRIETTSAVTLAETLQASHAAPVHERTAVLAVGSNANPGVMLAKLRAARADTTVVFLQCRVTHLAVGHSAHVSAAGFVPAAPFRRYGAHTSLHLLLLDDDQLRAVDATEPNYRRVSLDPAVHPVRVGSAVEGRASGKESVDVGLVQVYASRHGLLADALGRPVALTRQHEARTAFLQGRPPATDQLGLLTRHD